MIKALLITGSLVALVGCSSAPKVDQSQYCYTDQLIHNNNGTVSSQTTLECTDRPGRQAQIQRAGIDKSCREFWYDEVRNGRVVEHRGVRCEKLDGSWEILNINGYVR